MINEFFILKEQWLNETKLQSFNDTSNLAYKKLIELGEEILPLIFFDMSASLATNKEIHHWFGILTKITGQNPIQDKNLGDIINMAYDWIEWASFNNYKHCLI